jgi:hypothetical protein
VKQIHHEELEDGDKRPLATGTLIAVTSEASRTAFIAVIDSSL